MKYCSNCGTKVSGAYCSNCGKKVEEIETKAVVPTSNHTSNSNRLYAPQYKPISAWGYFGYSLLFALPIAGLILLIVFSFDDENVNRRNYARSYWCALLVALCITVIVFGILFSIGFSMFAIFS